VPDAIGVNVPTYEYKCSKCGGTREVYREFSDDTLPVCCESSMERVWSAVPTIFKTGGFYKTGN